MLIRKFAPRAPETPPPADSEFLARALISAVSIIYLGMPAVRVVLAAIVR